MNSPGHKANILNSGYREFGVGYYSSRWTQDFGARSAVYPMVINREAASTGAPQVSLYIYRQAADWTEMRLNDSGQLDCLGAFRRRQGLDAGMDQRHAHRHGGSAQGQHAFARRATRST